MLFNSQFFIFVFLPLVWGVSYVLERRGRRDLVATWLLLCSIAFYGWWSARYLALLVPLVLFNFWCGLAIGHAAPASRARHALLASGIALNLAVLAFFKYANFLLDNVAFATGWSVPPLAVVLPLGISFFIFQKIAYLVDVTRGMAPEPRVGRYALFVAFFPQLIAGPIVHYGEIRPSFDRAARTRARIRRDLAVGISIFVIGLAKKVLIADHLAPFVDASFETVAQGQPLAWNVAWAAALAFTFQLYFDFSGYSDMAVGLARMFGVDLPWNFHSPYQARGFSDFWRRWHITLSRFLRDYLYIPLGGNRRGASRTTRNLLVTMALGGLWHGANWTFVAWGVFHGVLLAIERALVRSTRWRPPALVVRAVTFLLVMLGWVLFRAADMATARAFYAAMLAPSGATATVAGDTLVWLAFAAAIAWFAPATADLFRREMRLVPSTLATSPRGARWRMTSMQGIVVGLVFLCSVLLLDRIAPFLYFQF